MQRADRLVTTCFALLVLAASSRTVSAQTDLTGNWQPIFHEDQVERIPGPEVGDYAGLPITAAARMRADAWDASLLTLPEHQCKPHPSTYGFRGVGLLRIAQDIDNATQRVVRIQTHIMWQEQEREIFMDGRPHPPEYAAHTWQGFSTGTWVGDMLVVKTTHLKAGWMRRNGLPLTDRATMTDLFVRHGDYLTHIMMLEDPVYLSEPLVKTNGFRLDPNAQMQPYPCSAVVEVERPQGVVPHHLPGENPYLHEYADRHGLPYEATRGGSETMYPEYMAKVRSAPATSSSARSQR